MTKRPLSTRAELLAAIEPAWVALNGALNRLTETQKTTIRDAQGWTVKDHVIHLAAWERSVVYMLEGQPRSAGLGVDQTLYEDGSADDINAVIYRERKEIPLPEVMAQLRAVHQHLMQLLQPLSDADLNQPYRHYLPQELGDDRAAIDVVYINTAGHFEEHLNWIEALVGRRSK